MNDHERFKYRKSNWKRKTKRVLEALTKLFEDAYYGRRPNMHDVWDYAEELVELGAQALELNIEAARLKKAGRVLADISRGANKVESASKHLRGVAVSIGMPEDIPQFVSPLVHGASEEAPKTTLEDVLASQDPHVEG